MIELFRERDMTRVGQFQSLLESEGIRTFVRNESLSVTEASIPVFFPALCILDERDHARAVELIRAYEADVGNRANENCICPNCGEESPGTFATCWNCGADIPDPER